MAIPLVQVRHKVTGRKTFLPESALRTFPDYVKTPSQKSRDQVPDGTAFPAQTSDGDQPPATPTAATSSASTTSSQSKG